MMPADFDAWVAEVIAKWRSNCWCGHSRKPCPYHEGMADALDAVAQWLAIQDLDVQRLNDGSEGA